jgi:hypothetical protein
MANYSVLLPTSCQTLQSHRITAGDDVDHKPILNFENSLSFDLKSLSFGV